MTEQSAMYKKLDQAFKKVCKKTTNAVLAAGTASDPVAKTAAHCMEMFLQQPQEARLGFSKKKNGKGGQMCNVHCNVQCAVVFAGGARSKDGIRKRERCTRLQTWRGGEGCWVGQKATLKCAALV